MVTFIRAGLVGITGEGAVNALVALIFGPIVLGIYMLDLFLMSLFSKVWAVLRGIF